MQQNLDRTSCDSSTAGMEAEELSVAVDQLQHIKCDLLGGEVLRDRLRFTEGPPPRLCPCPFIGDPRNMSLTQEIIKMKTF